MILESPVALYIFLSCLFNVHPRTEYFGGVGPFFLGVFLSSVVSCSGLFCLGVDCVLSFVMESSISSSKIIVLLCMPGHAVELAETEVSWVRAEAPPGVGDKAPWAGTEVPWVEAEASPVGRPDPPFPLFPPLPLIPLSPFPHVPRLAPLLSGLNGSSPW